MGVEPTQNCFAGSGRAVWLRRQVASSGLRFPASRTKLSLLAACRYRGAARNQNVLARSRTWSSTFAGSRANPSHPEDACFLSSTLPRNRTSSGSFEDCHAIRHTHRANCQVSRPGLEPGPGPSEGPMRSATPSRRLLKPTLSMFRVPPQMRPLRPGLLVLPSRNGSLAMQDAIVSRPGVEPGPGP